MRKILTITISVILVALLIGIAIAQPPHEGKIPKGQRGKGGEGMRLIHFLKEEGDLTEKQEEQIKEIMIEYERENIDLKANLEKGQLDLRVLMMEKQPNRDAINKKVREIGEIRTELTLNKVNEKLDIREILTDEQWEKVKDAWLEAPGAHRPKGHHKPENAPRAPRPPRDED